MAPLLRLGALALCTTLMGHAVASESPAGNCRPINLAFYELGLLYYRDAQRNANGIDVDLVRELSARSGCRFDTVLDWRVRIWSQLAAGELDASVSGIATPERSEFAELVPYFQTRNYAVVRRSLPASAKSLSGFLGHAERRIGVVQGFKQGQALDEWLGVMRERGRVVESADFATVVRLFEANRIDAFLALPTSWLHKQKEGNLAASAEMLDWAPKERIVHGLILSKARLNNEERAHLRKTLEGMRADGTVARILRRHVGPELAKAMLVQEP